MNTKLFTLALVEILLAVSITVVIVFVSYKLLKWFFFRNEDLRGDNMAFTIFTAGIILSIGLILSEIVPSITNIIRISVAETDSIDSVTILKYSTLYLLIGFIAAIVINGSVFFLFSMLTKGVNELKEIKNNNVSVAILVVAILVSITLIAKDSIALLISALVPYPEVSNFL